MAIKHKGYYVYKTTIPAGSQLEIEFPSEVVTIDFFNGTTDLLVVPHFLGMMDAGEILIPANCQYSFDANASGLKVINNTANPNSFQVVGWYEV